MNKAEPNANVSPRAPCTGDLPPLRQPCQQSDHNGACQVNPSACDTQFSPSFAGADDEERSGEEVNEGSLDANEEILRADGPRDESGAHNQDQADGGGDHLLSVGHT